MKSQQQQQKTTTTKQRNTCLENIFFNVTHWMFPYSALRPLIFSWMRPNKTKMCFKKNNRNNFFYSHSLSMWAMGIVSGWATALKLKASDILKELTYLFAFGKRLIRLHFIELYIILYCLKLWSNVSLNSINAF